jgi:hypothetical protein
MRFIAPEMWHFDRGQAKEDSAVRERIQVDTISVTDAAVALDRMVSDMSGGTGLSSSMNPASTGVPAVDAALGELTAAWSATTRRVIDDATTVGANTRLAAVVYEQGEETLAARADALRSAAQAPSNSGSGPSFSARDLA